VCIEEFEEFKEFKEFESLGVQNLEY